MGYWDREKFNAYMRKRYEERKALGHSRLGGKCVACETKDNLQFDHIDEKTKSFEVLENWNMNLQKWLKEVDKCQLLCKPCHIKKHTQVA